MASVKRKGQSKGFSKGTGRAAPKAASSGNPTRGTSRTPLLVLIILILLTAMVFLINKTEREPGKRKLDRVISQKDEGAGKDLKEQNSEKKEPDEKTPNEGKDVQAQSERTVSIYFIKIHDNTEKIILVPVKRKVNEENFIKEAIVELIRGPSAYEKKRGYISAIPDNLKLRNVRMKEGSAVLDFSPALGEGAGGTILLSRLDQIVYTVTQFKEIKSVEITINGMRQKTLGADGLSISGPLHRRE